MLIDILYMLGVVTIAFLVCMNAMALKGLYGDLPPFDPSSYYVEVTDSERQTKLLERIAVALEKQ